MELGYALSSEEHRPLALVEHARRAEEAGFSFALLSDHFHPWTDRQGQSPFVWSVLGGIAVATERLVIGTGVTCPTIRIHPAIIAQATATAASMLPGRFFLGVGTGENLNEHVLGAGWPSADVRLEMLEESIAVMRLLWEGELTDHRGRYYTVEDARIYTLPEEPIQVMVAAGAERAAELAGRVGDGFVGTSPEAELLDTFANAGGTGKPRYGQITVCFADSERAARQTAYEVWPNAALKGPLAQELPLPSHFEAAVEMVSEDDVAEQIACGPDPERHIALIEKYVEAGYDRVYVHQVGSDQDGFLRFYESEILPRYADAAAARDR
ncbi:MAG: TIGR03557 family F420-dependent LLM class oxidoreductase [Gaiellaceae bacterium]|nr:TIGR03557 family F420-dependent LLM class oxidoreductase [Actinomycetota bacterium]